MRIALSQVSTSDGDLELNLKRIEMMCEYARSLNAELVIFPELSITGFKVSKALTTEELLSMIDRLAKDVAVGLGFPLMEGEKTYNAYAIIENGKILYLRKKLMLFKPMKEDKIFHKGNRPEVFKLDEFEATVLICYELRFPELFDLGAELFIVPAAWPSSRVSHWNTLLRARAIENMAYTIGVNRWGEGTHGPFGGNSCTYDPFGEGRCLGEGEGVLVVEIKKDRVLEAREFPAYSDRLRLRGPP